MPDTPGVPAVARPGRPHTRQGFILPATLIFMMALMLIALMISSSSLSGLQQAGGHSGLLRARAAAEAGHATSTYTLSENILGGIQSTLNNPYALNFAQSGADPQSTNIIPPERYGDVLTSLNMLPNLQQTGTVGSGTYSTQVSFRNFREDRLSFNPDGQRYLVDYTIVSQGAVGTFRRTIESRGSISIQLGRVPLNSFLILADDGGSQQGNFYGTGMNYDGPVHVNQNWRFAGSPIFSRGATTASSTVQMWSCTARQYQNVNTQSNGCTTPNWSGYGLQYAVPKVDLPKNTFSQMRAALGLPAQFIPTPQQPTDPGLTKAELCSALGINPCPSNGPPNGVYLRPGGGIYVQGDAQVELSVENGKQVYVIRQGSSVTTLKVDANGSGSTTVTWPNNTTTTLAGIPNGQLYVEGSVSSLKGPARTGPLPNPLPNDKSVPSQVPPAIAASTRLNITAKNDVVIQGDLVYQDNPALVSGARNVLGIMAGTGNLRIGGAAPNDLYLQAALIAGASGKGFAVDNFNTGNPRGSIHLQGSLAEALDPPRGRANISSNGTVNIVTGYGDAFNFDQRFLNGRMSPPFFPTTSVFATQAALPTQIDWTER